jgi:hypothetical protein
MIQSECILMVLSMLLYDMRRAFPGKIVPNAKNGLNEQHAAAPCAEVWSRRQNDIRCHAGSGQPATKWLDEHNTQRVSYFEPTIFTLRQAGISVEPHWFGPIKCAFACARQVLQASAYTWAKVQSV